jgi:virulence-associated protein VapD
MYTTKAEFAPKIIDRQKRNKTTEGFDNLSYLLEHYQFKNSQIRSLGYAYYDTNKDPKTDKSAAGVSFSKSILPILKMHLEEQDNMKKIAGDNGMKLI